MGILKNIIAALGRFWSAGFKQKAVVVIAAAVAVMVATSLGGGSGVDTSIAVTRGSIRQTVSVTGQVKAVDAVALSFQNSGRVARIDAKVGDRVVAGQVLAALDNSETAAQLRDAEATVLARKATLEEMELGGSPQEIAIGEAAVRSAEQGLEAAYENTYRELSDAYNRVDSALRITLRPLFREVGDTMHPAYQLTFTTNGYAFQTAALNGRADAEIALRDWEAGLQAIAGGGTPETYTAAIAHAQDYARRVSTAVSAAAKLFDGTIALGLEGVTENEYRSLLNSARGSVVGAMISVNNQDQNIKDRKISLTRARSELAFTAGSATPQALTAQRAAVLSAQAQVDRFHSLISKGIIRSPIDGIVTLQDAKVGQNASANVVLVAVISDQQLELQANISEVDIGQVRVGDPVAVTVDALPAETLSGSVVFIEPGETIVDGVVNFKVTALLSQPDPRLKSGLTVNMDIETERHDEVLILPQFAIIENDEGTFVRGLDGSDVPVTLGIRSQDGMVEITSGLSEGARVQNIGLKLNGN